MGGTIWSAQEDAHIIAVTPVSDGWDKVLAGLNRTHASVRLRARQLGVSLDRDAVKRRHRSAASKTFSDPVVVAARARTQSANHTLEQADEKRQRAKDMRLHLYLVASPEIQARRIAGIRAFHRKKLGFCPDYLLPFYREMKAIHGMSFVERKAAIVDTFGRDLRRAFKAIAEVAKPLAVEQRRQYRSFEAELERARVNGIRPALTLRAPEFHLSLTGSSLA